MTRFRDEDQIYEYYDDDDDRFSSFFLLFTVTDYSFD